MLAQKNGDSNGEGKWLTHLKPWQVELLKTLRNYHDGALHNLFKDLSPLSLDWEAFKFGRLRGIMQLHCEEVYVLQLKVWNVD